MVVDVVLILPPGRIAVVDGGILCPPTILVVLVLFWQL